MTVYGPWRCEPCKKEYLTEEALHQHVREKHEKPARRDRDDEDQREVTQ